MEERRGAAAVRSGLLWPATEPEAQHVRQFLNETRPDTTGIFYSKDDTADKPVIEDHVFQSNSELVRTLQRATRNNKSTVNSVNFTQAGIKKNKAGEHRRKLENIETLRSFWIDCDVRPGQVGNYATYAALLDHLEAFHEAVGISPSFVVDSGLGTHSYYSLGQDISYEDWKPIARELKLAMKNFGLLSDAGVSVSGNQPLRLPYSLNLKKGRPPKMLHFLFPNHFRLQP